MTPLARTLVGAAIGALVTLSIHPTSRPYLTSLFASATPSDLAAQLYLRSERLPTPRSPAD
ncbi:MAG TPA: hypothetical protein VGE01_14305, partial [Fimbriimonas sp.]